MTAKDRKILNAFLNARHEIENLRKRVTDDSIRLTAIDDMLLIAGKNTPPRGLMGQGMDVVYEIREIIDLIEKEALQDGKTPS